MEEVLWRTAEPVKIKLERGKTYVGWEISIKGDDADKILAQLIDSQLQLTYNEVRDGNQG